MMAHTAVRPKGHAPQANVMSPTSTPFDSLRLRSGAAAQGPQLGAAATRFGSIHDKAKIICDRSRICVLGQLR